jgi:hypothetical protein
LEGLTAHVAREPAAQHLVDSGRAMDFGLQGMKILQQVIAIIVSDQLGGLP